VNKTAIAIAIGAVAVLGLILMPKAEAAIMNTNTSGALGVPAGGLGAYANFFAFDDLFRAAGAQYGVDPLLLKAIAIHESSLNPNAANTSDPADPSYGLMQMSCMPDGSGGCRASEFNLPGWPPANQQALFDPATSIGLGAALMAQNLRAVQGNVWQAVAMYNSGQTYDPAYTNAVSSIYKQMGG